MPSIFSLTALMLSAVLLSGCTAKQAIKTPVNILGALFGYTPPQTTMLEELNQAYEMCKASGGGEECVQEAYQTAQQAKGITPKALPKGTVIVREVKETTGEKTPAQTAGEKSP